MAILSSLNKFTVPGANGQVEGLLMPKLKYRFRVLFTNFGTNTPSSHELTKQVMSAGRPQLTFENMELAVYNSKINYAGRYTWEAVQIVLRDDSSNSVSQLVASQIQKQFDFFEQSSAASGSDYKFQTDIEILDGGNGTNVQVLETFQLYGCYIQQTQYQQADYKVSDPLDITLTIKYDNAVQGTSPAASAGFGQSIGRTLGTIALGGIG